MAPGGGLFRAAALFANSRKHCPPRPRAALGFVDEHLMIERLEEAIAAFRCLGSRPLAPIRDAIERRQEVASERDLGPDHHGRATAGHAGALLARRKPSSLSQRRCGHRLSHLADGTCFPGPAAIIVLAASSAVSPPSSPTASVPSASRDQGRLLERRMLRPQSRWPRRGA